MMTTLGACQPSRRAFLGFGHQMWRPIGWLLTQKLMPVTL